MNRIRAAMPAAMRRLKGCVCCREGVIQILAFFAVAAILVLLFFNRHQLVDFRHYRQYGYPGLLLVNIVGSAALVLPVPIDLAIIAAGAVLNPLVVALVAATGQVVGEMTGYLLGFSGRVVLENQRGYARMEGWMKRRGSLTIFVLSAVPNPIFNVAGIAAGALRFPVWKFLLYSWAGRVIKNLGYAMTGALGAHFFLRFFA